MFPEDDDSTMQDDNAGGGGEMKGDGLHHHEIHEDEGGGYRSVHTHPDGHKEASDHVTYDEAKDKMDQDFGHGDGAPEDDGADGDDMSTDDIAGSYGRKADCD
jgi:hypothetical protein